MRQRLDRVGGTLTVESAPRLTTIKTHLLHIYTKLGVGDRAAAYQRGLLG
jgi:ATP/maltotriose-dependent transcriptional regulator MalT